MVKESDMKKELLGQVAGGSGGKREKDRELAQKIIEKEKARIRRTKWETVIAWGLVVICFIIGAVVERLRMRQYFDEMELVWSYGLPMILRALLLIAIIFTVLLYTRSRTLAIRQIQARLADIEALIKKMAEER
jgi:SNF family Na+-dependent transporter